MAPADESAIYRDLMRFKPDRLTPNAWAVKAGVSRTVWADMKRHGNPSRRTLEKLLSAAGSSLAEFEALRIGADNAPAPAAAQGVGEARRRGWGGAPLAPLPLHSSSLAGGWGDAAAGIELMLVGSGEPIDHLPRPQSLAADPSAYAVTIVDKSMWPRFRPGRRVAVSPRSPIAVGDDVMVRLRTSGEGQGDLVLLKELVRRTPDGLELRQFEPDIAFKVPADEVTAVEKVVGELI
jgi:hypothetical protein